MSTSRSSPTKTWSGDPDSCVSQGSARQDVAVARAHMSVRRVLG